MPHGHPAGAGSNPHDMGIEAHVIIQVNAGAEIEQALAAIQGINLGGKDPGNNFKLLHVHTALGQVDFIADVMSTWTSPMGKETLIIGQWVSALRQLKVGGQYLVKSAETVVCMNT